MNSYEGAWIDEQTYCEVKSLAYQVRQLCHLLAVCSQWGHLISLCQFPHLMEVVFSSHGCCEDSLEQRKSFAYVLASIMITMLITVHRRMAEKTD